MFEACLEEGGILKKVLEAIKELLSEATWDCGDDGIKLQVVGSSIYRVRHSKYPKKIHL